MKEEDIRPGNLKDEQFKLIEEDLKLLTGKKDKFVKVNCPACNSKEYSKSFEKFGLDLVECKKCNTLFMNPRPTLEILENYYKNSKCYDYWNKKIFPESEEGRRKNIFLPRLNKLRDICKRYNVKTNSFLEIGPGYGTFSEEIKNSNLFNKITVVETTPCLAETCREKGLNVIESKIEDVKTSEKFDVIAFFEVIEHFFDPKEFLLKCRSMLNDGGIIVLTCPNVKGFDLMLLKEKSDNIDAEHQTYFNLDSLEYLLKNSGFEVLEKNTPGQLDAEIVRKKIIEGKFIPDTFLKHILIEKWDELGGNFQKFITENNLSSNMWFVARKC